MSLDVYLTDTDGKVVFDANITHNLNKMAEAAGIYKHLWRPEELGLTKAYELIAPLNVGLHKLILDKDHYITFNAANGWGVWDDFIPWIEKYIAACEANPDATVSVSR